MNRGGATIYVIVAILIVGSAVSAVVYLGPVYQHKWKYAKQMEEALRAIDSTGEEKMMQDLMDEAKKMGLPPLDEDSFYLEGGEVGEPALLQCEYIEKIKLPAGKIYPMRVLIEINIPKLPARAF